MDKDLFKNEEETSPIKKNEITWDGRMLWGQERRKKACLRSNKEETSKQGEFVEETKMRSNIKDLKSMVLNA